MILSDLFGLPVICEGEQRLDIGVETAPDYVTKEDITSDFDRFIYETVGLCHAMRTGNVIENVELPDAVFAMTRFRDVIVVYGFSDTTHNVIRPNTHVMEMFDRTFETMISSTVYIPLGNEAFTQHVLNTIIEHQSFRHFGDCKWVFDNNPSSIHAVKMPVYKTNKEQTAKIHSLIVRRSINKESCYLWDKYIFTATACDENYQVIDSMSCVSNTYASGSTIRIVVSHVINGMAKRPQLRVGYRYHGRHAVATLDDIKERVRVVQEEKAKMHAKLELSDMHAELMRDRWAAVNGNTVNWTGTLPLMHEELVEDRGPVPVPPLADMPARNARRRFVIDEVARFNPHLFTGVMENNRTVTFPEHEPAVRDPNGNTVERTRVALQGLGEQIARQREALEQAIDRRGPAYRRDTALLRNEND